MMMTNRLKKLESLLQQRFGIGFLCESHTEGGYPVVRVRLADLKAPHGFRVSVKLLWKSIEIRFVQDSFSGDLIRDMGQTQKSEKIVSTSFASALEKCGGSLNLKVNGNALSATEFESWPAQWTRLELTYDRIGIDPVLDNVLDSKSEIFQMCLDYLGIIISLLPVEKGSYEEPLEGLPEGRLVREEVNRYERNRLNREACIAINGTTCMVCGFNFSETYGDLGDGFIHVHHIIPVSQLGEGYIVDPSRDLVPVCANCHSMMHRSDPPLTVDELKLIINQGFC